MAVVVANDKPLSTCPVKLSAPLGAAMAFMGIEGSLPLFHGSQGCTAFALVMLVRHFRESIPLQTTAMNEISTILGGAENVEQALLNIQKRAKPRIVGLVSTALTETRGEDMRGDLAQIRRRNPELADTATVLVSAPDYEGSLETGWAKAVTAIVESLAEPAKGRSTLAQVNVLAGSHLSAGDIEAIRQIVEDFGLEAIVLPDLSGSLDGHVPETYVPTTLGGTTLDEVRRMGRSRLTIAIGEHMRAPAAALEARTGVPTALLDRVTGLEAVDRLMVRLSEVAGKTVPARYRRQRSQLVDAMLDGHFFFGGRQVAIAGEPALLATWGGLVTEMGATLAAAVASLPSPSLAGLECERLLVGDFQDLEDAMIEAGGCDLVIANSNARQLCDRHGIPHFRAGFPVFDRLGAAHQVVAGYRGTRDAIFALANALIERGHEHSSPHPIIPSPLPEHSHGDPAAAAG